MNSAPISAICPGCIDGSCNNGVGLMYPPYSSMPDDLVMQCIPVGPIPVPEYMAYGYGAPYFGHFAPQYPQAHKLYEPHNHYQGHWQNRGRKGSSKTRGRKTSPSHVYPVAITSELEYALAAIKMNPQVTLFTIHGESTP